MKKLQTILVLLLITSVFVSGCVSDKGNVSNNGSGVQRASEITKLRIGHQPSVHHIAFVVADEKGWWQADLAPYGVKDVKEYVFQTGPPEMQAMMAGDLDVAYVGAAPAVTALSQGLDAKIVAACTDKWFKSCSKTRIQVYRSSRLKGTQNSYLSTRINSEYAIKKMAQGKRD